MVKSTNKQLISLLDLTSLDEKDDDLKIIHFCQQAKTPLGHVAAVCIYPRFVKIAHSQLRDTKIHIATVVNFPSGNHGLKLTTEEIQQAIHDGATEIDVVMPYQAYLDDEKTFVKHFVTICKLTCGSKVLLKVILETSALRKPNIITDACQDVIGAGANFLKTSTGKHPNGGATLEAAEIILNAIKTGGHNVGLKVSGGIRTLDQALAYVDLAKKIMGENWVSPNTFRIGASTLLQELLK